MEIRILGTGCPKCHKLEEETRNAAAEMGLACNIEKVTDLKDIMSYGVMLTPALVVDETGQLACHVEWQGKQQELGGLAAVRLVETVAHDLPGRCVQVEPDSEVHFLVDDELQ